MKWPSELIIIRHGQSARNVQKAAAKQTGSTADYSEGVRDQDTPLTPMGILQAEATGRWLASEYPNFKPGQDEHTGPSRYQGIDTMFVSPYLRTRQTAERLMYGMGYQPKQVVEERIREIEFGIMDGLTPDGMKAKFPEEVARRKREGKYWYRAPGGESRPDVRLRGHSFLGTISRDYQEKTVVVIAHSVVVLALRSLLERWGEEQYLIVDQEDDVLNCGVTLYRYNYGRKKLVLESYNRTYYKANEGA